MKTTFSLALIMLCTITVSAYGVPPDMVPLPGGEFQMGDFFNEGYWGWDELPVHSVQLDPFRIGQYEVTNQQYCEFLNSAFSQSLVEVKTDNVVYRVGTSTPYCSLYVPNSSRISRIAFGSSEFYIVPSDKAGHPVVLVTWYGAAAYTNWRSEQEGKEPCYDLSTWECNFSQNGYRLPTEAEWEYSARGGLLGKRYPWGDTLEPGRANYVSSGDPYECGAWPYTTPVGFYNGQVRQKSDFGWPCAQDTYQTLDGSNGFGLYDMAGNVFEWCNDWFDPYFYRITPYPHTNPTGPSTGSIRVLRGGDWAQPGGPPEGCRVSNRIALVPSFREHNIGFRVVYIPEPLELTVSIDVKPGSCPNPLNVKDKGLLSVAICGCADFDVWTIDTASIRLEGVAPVRSSFEDVVTPVGAGASPCECTTAGPDGKLDLTLKFNVQDIVAKLGPVDNGDELELTLTGALDDAFQGTPIEGTDCIVIQGAK